MESGAAFFYGGIFLAAASALAGIVSFLALKAKSARLRKKLTEEYGPREKR